MSKCLLLMLAMAAVLAAQRDDATRRAWNQPVAPFRIVGNIYYVGVAGVTSFLITTPQGDILLDGGLPETAPLIEKNIATLGFQLKDVKVLLNSHAHFDHCGGLAELKRLTGAQMVASRGDTPMLEQGGPADRKSWQFPAVKVDRQVNDGDRVELGGTTLTALLTPGHTKGDTSWTMTVSEGGKPLNVVFYGSTSVVAALTPQMITDYEHTFARLKSVRCDVFLGAHPEFFGMQQKRARMQAGGPNPFIDSQEMGRFVAESEADFERRRQKR